MSNNQQDTEKSWQERVLSARDRAQALADKLEAEGVAPDASVEERDAIRAAVVELRRVGLWAEVALTTNGGPSVGWASECGGRAAALLRTAADLADKREAQAVH